MSTRTRSPSVNCSICLDRDKGESGLVLSNFRPLAPAYLAGVLFLGQGRLGLLEEPHIAIISTAGTRLGDTAGKRHGELPPIPELDMESTLRVVLIENIGSVAKKRDKVGNCPMSWVLAGGAFQSRRHISGFLSVVEG